MRNIYLTKKENNTEIWLNFKGKNGRSASLCLNNIALEQRGPITKQAMLDAIASELSNEPGQAHSLNDNSS